MMNSRGSTLFRAEVFRHRADRLHGNVNVATPVSWQLVGFLLAAALIVTIIFLFNASYARIETVKGVISLDKGVASVVPSRGGVVASLVVTEGQQVQAGHVLAHIRSEEDMLGGDTVSARVRQSLEGQDERLSDQGDLLLAASRAEEARLRNRIAGLGDELSSIEDQIADQIQLVATAEREATEIQSVAARGFISRRDLSAREATFLSRRQQLSQLRQLRASKRADLAEAERVIMQTRATAAAQIARAQSDRAALATQLAQSDLARGYAITSPIAGIVTALTARVGQAADSQRQLMMIVPADATLNAELYVPTAAAGFLRPQQNVRLAIDAFPYQQFGVVPARVEAVSKATIVKQDSSGPVPVYLVTASLPTPWVRAFGRRERLAPGMTLTARIITERRSLFEWLFEPALAVRNR
ncbi:MAG: HlyD family efflux transporter periplasmic adaptor subunit [Sphingomonadales bacterium]|nr:MAG: HlyD family efflux transporter periplasmic adaptor subunit [Sphingomonadales bacterium]